MGCLTHKTSSGHWASHDHHRFTVCPLNPKCVCVWGGVEEGRHLHHFFTYIFQPESHPPKGRGWRWLDSFALCISPLLTPNPVTPQSPGTITEIIIRSQFSQAMDRQWCSTVSNDVINIKLMVLVTCRAQTTYVVSVRRAIMLWVIPVLLFSSHCER